MSKTTFRDQEFQANSTEPGSTDACFVASGVSDRETWYTELRVHLRLSRHCWDMGLLVTAGCFDIVTLGGDPARALHGEKPENVVEPHQNLITSLMDTEIKL